MSRPKLAICDVDFVYLRRLDEYIRNHINLSFDIQSFSKPEILEEYSQKEDIKLLIVSETGYWMLEAMKALGKYKNILILDEESRVGMVCEDDEAGGSHVEHISKYQSASGIVDAVIDMCAKIPEDFQGLSTKARIGKSHIIGFYSPLSRCGQTTMAIRTGQILSRNAKTILLSFESFSSMGGLLKEEPKEDITDLLYYADCEKDKFCLYLERIKQTENDLDYIAPAKAAMQIRDITNQKLGELTELLVKDAGYEYILLDLTEYPDGFTNILRMCESIFMITRNTSSDKYRVRMFEETLEKNGCEDVASKVVKCPLPDLRDKGAYDNALTQLLIREGIIDGLKA